MLSPGQVAPPLRHIVRRSKNVRVEPAEVTGFDLEHRIVHASSPADLHSIEIPYDSLIVSGGATQSYFGHDDLATFGTGLSGKAATSLERLGVELRMNTRVTAVDVLGVDATGPDGSQIRIDAFTTIWAAGVQASPLATMLAEASGASLDRAGRIEVLPDLTLPGHPEVFAIGDMAALENLPGVAGSRCRADCMPPTPSCDVFVARRPPRSRTATSATSPPSGASGPSPACEGLD